MEVELTLRKTDGLQAVVRQPERPQAAQRPGPHPHVVSAGVVSIRVLCQRRRLLEIVEVVVEGRRRVVGLGGRRPCGSRPRGRR